jgi:hypothetical protein
MGLKGARLSVAISQVGKLWVLRVAPFSASPCARFAKVNGRRIRPMPATARGGNTEELIDKYAHFRYPVDDPSEIEIIDEIFEPAPPNSAHSCRVRKLRGNGLIP